MLLLLRKPNARRLVLIVVLALVLILSVVIVRVSHEAIMVVLQSKPHAIRSVNTSLPKVALTFDIGWGNKVYKDVLPILREHNVKCTIFVSGPWVRKNPDGAKQIMADGHDLQSHGQEHINYSQYSPEVIQKNLLDAHEIIKEVTGVEPTLVRPPNGDFDEDALRAAEQVGYQIVLWSLDSLDWKRVSADFIIRKLLDNVKPGDIILCHASDSAEHIAEALPSVITGLREEGFEIVTVPELLQLEKQPEPEPGDGESPEA